MTGETEAQQQRKASAQIMRTLDKLPDDASRRRVLQAVAMLLNLQEQLLPGIDPQ